MIRLILLLSLLSSCGPSIQVKCDNTTGFKHYYTPIYFSIAPEFGAKEIEGIKDAAKAWNKVLGKDLVLFSSNGFYIYKGELPADYNAVTRTKVEFTKYAVQVEIIVNNKITVGIDMESLMIHEFGHALGLSHTNSGVMYQYLSPYQVNNFIDKSAQDAVRCLYEY